MLRSFKRQRLHLQDALLRCRAEFMVCAGAEAFDGETAEILAAQIYELETRLEQLRMKTALHKAEAEADPALCVGV